MLRLLLISSLILMCTVHAKTQRLWHEGPFKEQHCSRDAETTSTARRTLPLSFRPPLLSCYLFPLKKQTGRIAIHSALLYGLMYTTKCQYIQANLWLNVFESQRNSKIAPLLRASTLCYLHTLTVICVLSRGLFVLVLQSDLYKVNQVNLNERLFY